MDPNSFLLNNQAPPPQNGLQNGVAPPPAAAATQNGAHVAMDVEEAATPLPVQAVDEKLKTRKEQEQDRKDLELGELLDMMEDWRPVVRRSPFPVA